MILNKSIKYSISFIKNSKLFNIYKMRLHTQKSKLADSEAVLGDVINNKGLLTLNRSDKLNAQSLDVLKKMLQKLVEWENSTAMVIVKGEGKAFSAGGDVYKVTRNKEEGIMTFRTGYTLYFLISQYPIPFVSLIHGIVMGAGVGLSLYGKVRVATEKTVFAMPETLIGLFPDCGVTHVLSRMPNHLGHFLGLTGHRLKGVDVVKAGIATHYIKSEHIPELYKGLVDLKEPKKDLNDFLLRNTENVSNMPFSWEPHLDLIDRTFSAPSVEEIISKLKSDGSEFALRTVDTLKSASPISLKITKKMMVKYKYLSLEECLANDYILGAAALNSTVSNDFYEGARALLVDKDNKPKWNPPTLEQVTDAMVEKAFSVLPPEEELNFKKRVNQLRVDLLSKL